ncbi:MAG: hypothetical protein M1823_004676 [Watsoniomyces obsoletus]|nr:MAG: hypothetical protein M1823_004676 [Watsoniomyces obsoletus]
MIRQDFSRIDPKRRATFDHKRRQFATPSYKPLDYPHRLNFYETPPTAEITLEQFEQWAIDRLRVLSELEACSFRNKTPLETTQHIKPLLEKYLPLSSNSSNSSLLHTERQKDHYSHFILRLAFSGTEDLRKRFVRFETALFRMRFSLDDGRERSTFVESLKFDWDVVDEQEKKLLAAELMACTPGGGNKQRLEDENWFKLDWERVSELVEGRRVLVKMGKAYVPTREQGSMVLSEFTGRLERALELTSRALPRLDEDDRLTPILNHLSQNFSTPSSIADLSTPLPGGLTINSSTIDSLSVHFPACMRNLHLTLRRTHHLKHYSRLQYSLFLKGIGLSLEECLIFWRSGFKNITDDNFNKEYRYNIRHVYGDVGGDANRRGRGYSPFSCQKILTERLPGPGETHGCPYRSFSVENLLAFLNGTGLVDGQSDRELIRGIKEDVEKKRYHIACNRVFEASHANQLKKVKEEGTMSAADLDTIVHPNTYFRRSVNLLALTEKKMEE